MISACELCEKITVENVLRSVVEHEKKMQTAKEFAETVIAPIIEGMTEIPDDFLLGYAMKTCVYSGLTEWKEYITNRGNKAYYREFKKTLARGMDYFDPDYVADYLAAFGFRLSVVPRQLDCRRYTTSTGTSYWDVDELHLSLMCPFEEEK